MEARLTALENRLRQTERALVVERLARQTAEVAQQTVKHGQLVSMRKRLEHSRCSAETSI